MALQKIFGYPARRGVASVRRLQPTGPAWLVS